MPLVSRNGQKSTPKLIMKLRFRYISFDLWQHLLAKTLQDGTLSQYLRCAHTLETYDISYDDTYITNNLHSSTEQYYCNSTLFMSTLDIASPKHAASSAATAMAILKKKYDQHEANQHQGNVKLGNLVQDKTISSRCQLKLTWTHPKGCHTYYMHMSHMLIFTSYLHTLHTVGFVPICPEHSFQNTNCQHSTFALWISHCSQELIMHRFIQYHLSLSKHGSQASKTPHVKILFNPLRLR